MELLTTSHSTDSSYGIEYSAVGTTEHELRALLDQWRGVMATSRPRWTGVDLTFTQLRVLSALAKRGSMRISELADEFGIGLAAASALADRMTRRGLLTRKTDEHDRRSVRLELSTRGRHLIERIERGSTEHFEKLIARMTPSEREAFATTMRAFLRLTEEHRLEKRPNGLVAVVRRNA